MKLCDVNKNYSNKSIFLLGFILNDEFNIIHKATLANSKIEVTYSYDNCFVFNYKNSLSDSHHIQVYDSFHKADSVSNLMSKTIMGSIKIFKLEVKDITYNNEAMKFLTSKLHIITESEKKLNYL